MSEIVGPTSHFYVSQRLRLHYVDWGNREAPLLVLVHGGRDHARSWDWVARALRRDWHVVAPDLRGHGDSSWAIGGAYTVADFVLDLANLVEALRADRIHLIGHSLGGAVSLVYSGVYPEQVARLVAIEGVGPPPQLLARMRERKPWERMQDWVEQTRNLAARQPRRYPTLEAAAARMREENAFLSEEQALHLTMHGVIRNEDGTYSWKFDNYFRAFAPNRFDFEELRALWGRIACPTLLVRGSDSWAGDPEADGRIQAFRDARSVAIAKAGHWVHHDQLDAFLDVVRSFFAEGDPAESSEADQAGK
ncbi:MAG TPA: alpha/beta hydrolase [Myxococcota bacterium]|jgi:pimeloyl-ACP methyl ester carboxylesterase